MEVNGPTQNGEPPTPGASHLSRAWAALRWLLSKSWDWPVTAVGAPVIYGLGVGALFGDGYGITSVLFFGALAWITAKGVTWEETRNHEHRRHRSAVVLLAGVAVFGLSLAWVHHRKHSIEQAQVAAPSPGLKETSPLASNPSTSQPVLPEPHTQSPATSNLPGTAPAARHSHPAPARQPAIPQTTQVYVAPPDYGDLKMRALKLGQDILVELWRNGWPYSVPENYHPIQKMPTEPEKRLEWNMRMYEHFKFRSLNDLVSLRDEFAAIHRQNDRLNNCLRDSRDIDKTNEQLKAAGRTDINVHMNPNQIEECANSLLELASELPDEPVQIRQP